jgi:DNA-binding transcriptional MerR regulator
MPDKRSSSEGLQVNEPSPGVVYSLDAVVHLTGVSRRSILVYCKSGLVRSGGDPQQGEFSFDDEAIYRIRRVEHLRLVHGVNLAGIRMIFDLMNELQRLENEMRFHRS